MLVLAALAGAAGQVAVFTLPIQTDWKPPPADEIAIWLLLFGFVTPLEEELVFRSALQRRFVNVAGKVAGIAACSLLFAALHASSPQAFLSAFVCAVICGFFAERTGRVWEAYAAHASGNIVLILLGSLAS